VTSPKRLLSLLLLATACASAPKPAAPPVAVAVAAASVALKPADEARPSLGLVVSAASPQKLAADLDAFATSLQMPAVLGQAALEKLVSTPLGGVTLTREQLGRLDAGQSLGVAMLVGAPVEGVCAAFSFTDGAAAKKTVDELGPETKKADGASVRKLASGTEIWTALTGRTLLTAGTRESLLAGGALALEAQRAPREGQVLVTLYPQNLAKPQGVPLANLVEMAANAMNAKLEESAKAAKAAPPPKGKKGAAKKGAAKQEPELTPAMSKMLVAFFKAAAQPVVEAQAVHFALKLDTSDGFRLRTEIVPLPGTPSAARTKTLPYALDAKLPVTDDRTTVIAFGEAGSGMTSLIDAFGNSGPAGKAMAQQMGKLMNEMIGGGSCTVRRWAPFENLCAIQLRPGVDPAQALASYAAALKGTQAWQDEVLGKKKSKVTIKPSKDIIDVEVSLTYPDQKSRELQRVMWGGDTQKFSMQARDGRLWLAQGAKPRELLRTAGEPGKGTAPIFTSVAARTKGAEALFFMDLMALVSSFSKTADDPSVKQLGAMTGAVPGLSELRAPLVFALWAGKTTAFDVQFPYQSFANVATVVRPFMGAMGGPPPPAPPK
jgi:hypothetical protein